ncbi:MAG TPA: hypothetical protein VHS54_03035 [Jatrophihabitans sp.]|nr:hypothetical protein [Jatrophihabitans sp.]
MSAPVRPSPRRLAGVLVALLVISPLPAACSPIRHGHPVPQVDTADAVTTRQATTWMVANLPLGVRIGIDFQFPDTLGPRGPEFDVLALSSTDWRTYAFVVSTAELRRQAGFVAPVAAALASSLPVARFGTGADRIEVRQIAAGGSAVLARRWRHDLATRRTAGLGLLQNPNVTEGASTAKVLRQAGLDLRAATVIALIAAKGPVRIVEIRADRVEAVVGRPARRMTVQVSDPEIVRSALAMLPPGYQPASVVPLPGRAFRLGWAVAVAPVPALD